MTTDKKFKAKNRLHYECVVLLSLLAILIFYNYYLPSKAKKEKIFKQEQSLLCEVRGLGKNLTKIENENEAFRANEPITIEKAIRKEFGWGRSNEVLIATPNHR